MLPANYTLTGRVSEHEDETDIELRAPNEKITIAENVDDRFAPLFLAAPDLLAALIALADKVDATSDCDHKRLSCEDVGCIGAQVKVARAAIANARGI